MITQIGTWLVEQAPVITVMGVVIVVLYRMYVKKDEQCTRMSAKAIEIAKTYEVKAEQFGTKDDKWKGAVLEKLDNLKIEFNEHIQSKNRE